MRYAARGGYRAGWTAGIVVLASVAVLSLAYADSPRSAVDPLDAYPSRMYLLSDPGLVAGRIDMPAKLDLSVQTVSGQPGVLITIASAAPFVNVDGELVVESSHPSGGLTFTALGIGTVAGVEGVKVEFNGDFDPKDGLRGLYIMGANGGLPGGEQVVYGVEPNKGPVVGDLNKDGVVSSLDALLVLQFAAGILDPLPNSAAADTNSDGVINAVDAQLIMQFSAGLVDGLPVL